MTRAEQWADPEIQRLIADLRSAIYESYLHRPRTNNSASKALHPAADEGIQGTAAEVFTHPMPKTPKANKFKVRKRKEPAA